VVGDRARLKIGVAKNSLVANFTGDAVVRGVQEKGAGGVRDRFGHFGSELLGGDDQAGGR